MDKLIQERLRRQQEAEAAQRTQCIRDLEIKVNRCISEVSWRFFPSGGPREIDVDAAEQLMHELFEALRALSHIAPRGGSDGTTV